MSTRDREKRSAAEGEKKEVTVGCEHFTKKKKKMCLEFQWVEKRITFRQEEKQ